MAQLPATDEVSLPGRIIFRSGVRSQLAKAALRLGEGTILTDKWWGVLGDESQNPPVWPTSKSVGDFDWTNLNPSYNNINLNTINGQKLSTLFNQYITTGETPVITIINDNIVKTVYGTNPDFVDLEAAYAWLSQRTISTLGSVTLKFPVGKITETKTYVINHPNGDRIFWRGGTIKQALPPYSSMQVSGNTAPAQAVDTLSNLTLLRQSFSTEIYFTQGGCISFTGNLAIMQNILITSDGDKAGKGVVNGITVNGGNVNLETVAIVGFDYSGLFITNSSTVFLANNSTCIAMGNGSGGVTVATNAVFAVTSGNMFIINNGARHATETQVSALNVSDNSLFASYPIFGSTFIPTVYVAGNSYFGIYNATSVIAGTMNLIVRLNGGTGVAITSGGSYRVASASITDNAVNGLTADTFSSCNAPNSNITNNAGIGVAAYNFSFIYRAGSNVANNGVNYSPALGASGNTGALIG